MKEIVGGNRRKEIKGRFEAPGFKIPGPGLAMKKSDFRLGEELVLRFENDKEPGNFLSFWIPAEDEARLRALCLKLGLSPSDLVVLLLRNTIRQGPPTFPSGGP